MQKEHWVLLIAALAAAGAARAESVTGPLEAVETLPVRPPFSGIVMEVKVEEHAKVKAGDTLVEMDARPLAIQYEQDKARGMQAEAEANLAAIQAADSGKTADRMQALGDLAPQGERDQAETRAAVEKIGKAKTAHAAQAAKLMIERSQGLDWKATVVALLDGWVLRRTVEAGSTVSAMDRLGEPMLVIAPELDRLRLRAALTKAQARDLTAGQTLSFTSPAHPKMVFSGTVAEVTALPAPAGSPPVFQADLRLDNPGQLLWPGDEVTARWGDEGDASVAKAPAELDAKRLAGRPKAFTDKDAAVVIGIEQYQNAPASDYSRSDAEEVRRHLLAMGMAERNIELLLDEKAGFAAVRTAVESWLPDRVRKGGRVFFYYSGHGSPEPTSGDTYLVPSDGDPTYLATTAYPLKTLYEKLGKLDADEVLVVLDACFSGSGGHSVIARGVRPLVTVAEPPKAPAKVAVVTAATGAQTSSSSPEKRHGVFTWHFLRALEDGKRSLSEVFAQAAPAVEDEARTLHARQTPQMVPPPEKAAGRFRF